MRIDAITIFPEYFKALDLSLLGKARDKQLIDLRVHDLRDHTTDIHKTVDDSPYGGGAGMLMKPEPWGKALDEILPADGNCTVIFTTPAGEQFKQATAQELSKEQHLVFACGRYEGIDQRVVEYAKTKAKVRQISLGDYVLNGGEVAALAMVEAIARLIPGVIGNAESLVEESHSNGLLEYPSYTKPASWRGFEVPEILISGHHANIAAWRQEQQLERTRQVRPDLLP
ncbi:MAG: tRNA (guanosine(37)-N1)-methyltransferase TrmD [Actinobacteria bacterium]|uniref:tRNA (guanine-N(1)-)-methyltransferase n=1 Tax=freshwater metagenome TaxID=449393 RepID=A0A6J6CZC4_9ZZZZ|nr:tRNA (guanosine(37)-N1)-methyltransferase TrmD [Actinomycetota bacterium]